MLGFIVSPLTRISLCSTSAALRYVGLFFSGLFLLLILLFAQYRYTLISKVVPLVNGKLASDDYLPLENVGLLHDLSFFAVLLFMFYLTLEFRYLLWRILVRSVIFLLALYYMLDVVVLAQLNTRPTVGDLFKFATEAGTMLDTLSLGVSSPLLLVGAGLSLALIIYVALVLADYARLSRGWRTFLLLFSGLLFVAPNLIGKSNYTQAWIVHNVFELNRSSGLSTSYSDNYVQELTSTTDDFRQEGAFCEEGQGRKENIVLLIIESLSMYHSQSYFPSDHQTPSYIKAIDKTAESSQQFVNFYSNGFTSESALVSLFTGRHQFPPQHWEGSEIGLNSGGYAFTAAFEPQQTVPNILNNNGYNSAFLTSGSLDFLNKGQWLKRIGFDYIEGAESPFYQGKKRYLFNAATDMFLYRRSMDYLKKHSGNGKLFLAIETVSSHHPFFDPRSGQFSESAAFEFADITFSYFMRDLKASGFFDNGMLLVMGDHRAMTPLSRQEGTQFGKSALSRVPMFIVNSADAAPIRLEQMAQQIDLGTSLDYYTGSRSCGNFLHGNFLATPPVPPQCVLFPRGDQRDLVDAYCGEQEATIRIDGDSTEVIEGNLPDADRILKYISGQRLGLY